MIFLSPAVPLVVLVELVASSGGLEVWRSGGLEVLGIKYLRALVYSQDCPGAQY